MGNEPSAHSEVYGEKHVSETKEKTEKEKLDDIVMADSLMGDPFVEQQKELEERLKEKYDAEQKEKDLQVQQRDKISKILEICGKLLREFEKLQDKTTPLTDQEKKRIHTMAFPKSPFSEKKETINRELQVLVNKFTNCIDRMREMQNRILTDEQNEDVNETYNKYCLPQITELACSNYQNLEHLGKDIFKNPDKDQCEDMEDE